MEYVNHLSIANQTVLITPITKTIKMRILTILAKLVNEGQFDCFKCETAVTEEDVTGVVFTNEKQQLHFKCSNPNCVAHLKGGYRTLKSSVLETSFAEAVGDEGETVSDN